MLKCQQAKRNEKSTLTKERIPKLHCSTVQGFFFTFILAKRPVGYLLLLSLLSNHLMIKTCN